MELNSVNSDIRQLYNNLEAISAAMVGGLEMSVLVQRIVDKIAEVLGADASSLYLLEYLFSWDEIPGNDNGRLIDFLKSNYDVDWITTAKIAKTDNYKTIMITAEKNFLSLNLNNENTELNLIIDNGKTDKFIVNNENGRLNIYSGNNWII